MRSKLVEKKVVLTVTIEPSIMQELRKYRDISGVSAYWLVSSLLAFRIGDGETGANKPKVKKVKGRYKNVNISFLFGFHNFVGFQKGMPIALVEGEKDAIALQTIYPSPLAMGRNTLGNNIKYLKYL